MSLKVQRDVATVSGTSKRSSPRLSAAKKTEISELVIQLRNLLGTQADKEAHTVQIVFTSDKHESVVLLT